MLEPVDDDYREVKTESKVYITRCEDNIITKLKSLTPNGQNMKRITSFVILAKEI